MNYLIILVLFACGTILHVLQAIKSLREKFPQFSAGEILKTFLGQEWDSLFCSLVILALYEIAVFIIHWNRIQVPAWFHQSGQYILAVILGYGGQRIAYKYLNTSIDVLEKKADRFSTTDTKPNVSDHE